MTQHSDFIPYILPLPKDRAAQRRFYHWVFGSDTALDVLRAASLERRIYQRDLIKDLDYSNKTIIETLKRLVALDVLHESMEKVRVKGKAVWVKSYTPTNIGRWIALLFLPLPRVKSEIVEDTLEQLFELYVKNAVQLCHRYGIDVKILREVFEAAFTPK
jgi:hypothetical protein